MAGHGQTVMIQKQMVHPSPTLNTVIMVEETLKNMPGSVMKVSDLKRALPKKVNHNALMVILEYLDIINKIYIGVKGITWLGEPNKRLQRAIDTGFEL